VNSDSEESKLKKQIYLLNKRVAELEKQLRQYKQDGYFIAGQSKPVSILSNDMLQRLARDGDKKAIKALRKKMYN
jgi:hypothetical protein